MKRLLKLISPLLLAFLCAFECDTDADSVNTGEWYVRNLTKGAVTLVLDDLNGSVRNFVIEPEETKRILHDRRHKTVGNIEFEELWKSSDGRKDYKIAYLYDDAGTLLKAWKVEEAANDSDSFFNRIAWIGALEGNSDSTVYEQTWIYEIIQDKLSE